MMNRRNAIRNVLLGSGGLITIPFWMQSCGLSQEHTGPSTLSSAELNILAAIADTIIPTGNKMGALSVGVDKFLQKLIDDCYELPVKDNVKKQLQALQRVANTMHGKNFAECDQPQKEKLLYNFSSSQKKDESDFFNLIKSETIRGFNTSQKVMEEYFHYKVAPGHCYGCININE